MRGAAAAILTVVLAAVGLACGATASAAPKPENGTAPRVTLNRSSMTLIKSAAADSAPEPRTYEALVRRFATLTPSDSMGNGDYRAAEAAFAAGAFDAAAKSFHEFARRYPRNLNVNDALSAILLIQDARDFEDRPLRLYARALAHRAGGRADSARALLAEAAERYPGAKARHRIGYVLAELARDRADHANALRWALVAADTASTNRTAPFALRIAAESSLEMGRPPQEALAYYRIVLERYPNSAVTPEARARMLEIRTRMPQ